MKLWPTNTVNSIASDVGWLVVLFYGDACKNIITANELNEFAFNFAQRGVALNSYGQDNLGLSL